MKITLLSSVHVLGYRSLIIHLHGRYALFSMETYEDVLLCKFYAIHMTGYPFGQKWYRYQKGIKGWVL